ncbi:MAG TPA: aminopeptidase [Candidatus Krumholzibacteriaceae bacterium]|nr:aminopeptidase [Candidatus Krumholzibacteriaceae bacterium]
MSSFDVEKLAILATDYCAPVYEGKIEGIVGNVAAAPLIQQLYKHILLKGGHPTLYLRPRDLEGLEELLFTYGNEKQITFVSPFTRFFYSEIDTVIQIYAETNTKRLSNIPPNRLKQNSASQREIIEIRAKRLLKPGSLAIIPYPTEALAQEAEMSLFEYQDFVAKACFLHKKDPVKEWKTLSKTQEGIVKRLNRAKNIRFVGEDTDLKMSVKARKWLNCDGHVNMPDGEVFTTPIENSAQGQIRFTYPGIEMSREVENITLSFKNGKVISAKAEKGEGFLKEILKTDEGAQRIGEIAIGTNAGIDRFTKNMLFDEKMGHCVHLALGFAPIPQETGGKNQSSIHWDLLKDMRTGEIYADNELIYQKGRFTI